MRRPGTHTAFFCLGLLSVFFAVNVLAQNRVERSPHGELTISCDACHSVTGWIPLRDSLRFNHDVATSFELVGRHTSTRCVACHKTLVFSDAQKDATCKSCHDDVHLGQFGSTCESCHTTTTFTEVNALAVHSRTSFPLTGAHLRTPCESCHFADDLGAFVALDTQCLACHTPEYASAHDGSGIPDTCLDCHNADTWTGAQFDHANSANGFALTGAHEPLACESCHNPPSDFSPIFAPANQDDCFTCHQTDYQSAPLDHVTAGFPTTCLTCHTNTTWNTPFDHASQANGFGLVGAHKSLECATCHQAPDLSLIYHPANQNDCISCHQIDYDDEHAGTGFPTTCLQCHSNTTWDDAVFDHAASANGFALFGAHEPLECSACHAPPPDFSPLFHPLNNDDCISCHQSDYDGQHQNDGFPTTCLTCHTPTTWQGAVFDHDAASFPVFSGKHREAWTECSDCHYVPQVFSQFSCLNCHEHRQSEVDNDHDEVNGYVYDSFACLSCHPQGEND